ncbi:MAG: cupin domain-containing protein [Pseudomonadota bacterium]
MMDPSSLVALSREDGEANDAFGFHRVIKVSAAQSGGRLTVFEEDVPSGGGPPLHIHYGQVELFYLISGTVRFRCGEEERELGAGSTVMVPPDTPHAFKNIGDGTARVLVAVTPGGLDEFMRKVAAEGLRPPADMARIAEIAKPYGLDFVGPPLS